MLLDVLPSGITGRAVDHKFNANETSVYIKYGDFKAETYI
jgi:hypothetical protein